MATYSIGDLEKLSGIKAHTIRMWEQRYGILRPQRTESNARTYNDADLQLLVHMALLSRHGWRISKIASMSREAIAAEVSAISQLKIGLENQWDVLTMAVLEMDEIKFSRLFDEQVQRLGLERAMLETGFPFLQKLNLLLLTGSVHSVQVQFIQQLLQHKIIAANEKTPLPTDRSASKFLLCSPVEGQEVPLLFLQNLLRTYKFQVVNLCQKISAEDLKITCGIHVPDYVLISLAEDFSQEQLQCFFEKLGEFAPESSLLLMGDVATPIRGSARVFKNMEEMIIFLESTTQS